MPEPKFLTDLCFYIKNIHLHHGTNENLFSIYNFFINIFPYVEHPLFVCLWCMKAC